MTDHEAIEAEETRIARLKATAADKIRAILLTLELDAGRRIESLGLDEIDVTRNGPGYREVLTAVRIELAQPMQRRWS